MWCNRPDDARAALLCYCPRLAPRGGQVPKHAGARGTGFVTNTNKDGFSRTHEYERGAARGAARDSYFGVVEAPNPDATRVTRHLGRYEALLASLGEIAKRHGTRLAAEAAPKVQRSEGGVRAGARRRGDHPRATSSRVDDDVAPGRRQIVDKRR